MDSFSIMSLYNACFENYNFIGYWHTIENCTAKEIIGHIDKIDEAKVNVLCVGNNEHCHCIHS